jgi:hypothetical protein
MYFQLHNILVLCHVMSLLLWKLQIVLCVILFCTVHYRAFRYVYFFEKKNPAIKVVYLSGLLALINEQVEGEEGKEGQGGVVEAHYRNTLGTYLTMCLNDFKMYLFSHMSNRASALSDIAVRQCKYT